MNRALTTAIVAAVALVGVYLIAGGGGYAPTKPPDPCRAGAPGGADGITGTIQRVGIVALSRAACDLHVGREELLLSLANERELAGIDDDQRNDAFKSGLGQAIDEEQEAGRIGDAEAFFLKGALVVLPIDAILDRVFGNE